MKNPDLDSLQHELHRTLNLPVVRDFSASNLVLLCHCYGVKLLEMWEAQQDRLLSAIHSEKIGANHTQPELKCEQQRLNTFWSRSESLECPSAKITDKEMTLNWQEIYELLDEAFGDQEEQKKGCELLQTLDYKVSIRHGNQAQLSEKLIHWLQHAHRFKDEQIRSIYYRLLNLSFEDSKDDQTYQSFIGLIHTEIEAIFEMRANYIRTIEQLNSQITDLIAQNTKKEIEEASCQPLPQVMFSSNIHRRTPARQENSAGQTKFKLMEERRSLQRSVEDMVAQLLTLKSDNEALRVRLFERDKQLNSLLMRGGTRSPTQLDISHSATGDRRKHILRCFEKQLGSLVLVLPELTVNKAFKRQLSSLKLAVNSEEDALSILTEINENLELLQRRGELQYASSSGEPLQHQLGCIVRMLDKLVVSEGKHGRDMDLIQSLFIEFRTLEASIKAEIRAELIGPKLMGSIARLQKMISKGDKKMQRLLEVEKGYLLELLGELVPTDRAIQTASSSDHCEQQRQREELCIRLQGQLNAAKEEAKQLREKIAEGTEREKELSLKRDEMSKLMMDASRRLVNMEKDSQKLQVQRNELLTEVRRLRQNFKEDKENIRDQVAQRDGEIGRLTKQLRHVESQLEQERKSFHQERNRLAEQIQLTGTRLEDIQKLAERKLNTSQRERFGQRGTPTLRRKMI